MYSTPSIGHILTVCIGITFFTFLTCTLHFLYSPELLDAGRGRARSHARHSSGSFDGILGIIRQQKDTTAEEDRGNTKSDRVDVSSASDPITDATTNDIVPATTNTTDANPSGDKNVDMCEKFGEGEGEGGEGWQGVVGRHSARKKKIG